MRALLVSLLFVACVFSAQMLDPLVREVHNGDIIQVGTMGPGQTLPITFHNEVYSGGIHGIGGNYDLAAVGPVPPGWSSSNSQLYGRPLQVTVTSSPSAREGTYQVPIMILDEGDGEKLGNITFVAEVEISNDVMDMSVEPPERRVGLGQPAVFEVLIRNKGAAGDLFIVSAEGVPKWSFRKTVYVPGGGSKKILYEVVGFEEEQYHATILVQSANAPIVREEARITITAVPDVLSDYKATMSGALLFPIFELPIYSLAGLLSNFW
ncbi:MAG TPA: hypothetical protein PKJ97_03340 [Candidatus Bilamarchaeaceae archaeon]|nr:hypothetical protein [Candidatus Bilamarchaeaceae archaeon]